MIEPNILIADDQEDILTLVSMALGEEGYRVRTARNGQEALDLAAEERPDLLILDGLMPKLSGFDVCKRVKGALYPDNPPVVIILTAIHRGPSGAAEAREIFCADHLMTKPFELSDLLDLVRRQMQD